MRLLTVETFQQSITICIIDTYSLLKSLKFTLKTCTFSSIFPQYRAIGSKYQLLLFTVPPAVSALTKQTKTIGENLESAIDMSNLMLKYIPQDTLFFRNMSLMQKALFFASSLNKGSYGFNGFGHNIVLEDFFEVEGVEPPRKKCV